MKKEKTDRAVLEGLICGGIAILLFFATIIAEIFFNISKFIPLIFAAYTILSVLFVCLIPESPQSKWKSKTSRFIIPFAIMELMFIVPYLVILFIESII